MSAFNRARRTYLSYVLCLARPGHAPTPIAQIDQNVPGELKGWRKEDLLLLVEEGRRHDDEQRGTVNAMRARAQIAFTSALALFAVVAAEVQHLSSKTSNWTKAGIAASGLLTFVGALGSLSIFAVAVKAPKIHPTVMSQRKPAALRELAEDYAYIAVDWTRLSGTMLTVLREAILYISLGAGINGLLWILTSAS
jgi:hypothetical protein